MHGHGHGAGRGHGHGHRHGHGGFHHHHHRRHYHRGGCLGCCIPIISGMALIAGIIGLLASIF